MRSLYDVSRRPMTAQDAEGAPDNGFATGAALGLLIGALLFFVVASALITPVADNAKTAQNSANVTGAANTIVGLYTLFFALLGLAGAAAIISHVMGSI